MILNNKLIFVKQLLQNIRQFHCSHLKNAYEGSGKTTLTILNLEAGPRTLINNCTPLGFKLVGDVMVVGPLVIFPKHLFCWNVGSANDINEKSLSLFTIIEPKLDIVVLGLETQYDMKAIKEMKRPLLEKNISVEVLPVERACGIFNFLNEEGRYVAAGLIPPLPKETFAYKRLQANKQEIQKQKAIESEK
ncbi:NADH dehydrogenase [ubiquinone] 1 alpha subcomplex assembly factor 3 [Calliopsis andreniformis]|uniref:NADH dehydrogenase [ubiquinone] 1 alpha subcomplex assembly factor 3 n=1 Tax=Calliopsis andreniformis TaxID=337506 RepID=UPI003FCD0F32